MKCVCHRWCAWNKYVRMPYVWVANLNFTQPYSSVLRGKMPPIRLPFFRRKLVAANVCILFNGKCRVPQTRVYQCGAPLCGAMPSQFCALRFEIGRQGPSGSTSRTVYPLRVPYAPFGTESRAVALVDHRPKAFFGVWLYWWRWLLCDNNSYCIYVLRMWAINGERRLSVIHYLYHATFN